VDQDALRLCSHLRSIDKIRQISIFLVVEEEEIEQLAKGFDLGSIGTIDALIGWVDEAL